MKHIFLPVLTILSCYVSSFAQLRDKDYSKADSMASLYPGHSLKDLYQLTLSLTTPLETEEEKFRAIYRWVCNNIDNDYNLYLKNKSKREKLKNDSIQLNEWNKNFTKEVLQILVNKHRTVCTGYAYLVKEMSSYVGISCEIINGYGRTIESNIGGDGIPNHSWNAVKLNGKWYLCDPTWSAGAVETMTGTYAKKFDEAFFLTEPETFVWKHYPLDTTWMLLGSKPTLRSFLDGPIVYSGALLYGLESVSPDRLNSSIRKDSKVMFQFRKHNDKPIHKIELLVKGSRALPRKLQTYINNDGLLCFEHVFPYKMNTTIHILVNGEYAFTYVFDVKG